MIRLFDEIDVYEENFDSCLSGPGDPPHIDPRLISNPQILSHTYKFFLNYSIKSVNVALLALSFHSNLVALNYNIQNVFELAYKIRVNVGMHLHECDLFNQSKEQIIHSMKRFLDDLVMFLCIYHDKDYFENNKKIRIESIGMLLNCSSRLGKLIKDDLNYNNFCELFKIINDLHNSYKHSFFLHESRLMTTNEGVAFFSLYIPRGDIKKAKYIACTLYHIKKSFNAFLLDFFGLENASEKPKIVRH